MKKRFIVLIDFSDHSKWLLSLSHRWAKEVDAKLLLIHHSLLLVPGIADRTIRENVIRSNERNSLEKLHVFAQNTVGADPTIKFQVESHNLSAAIMDLQEPDTIDYVFVGINDRSPIENFFTESTAVKLADEIQSIIIAIPTSRVDFNFDILYFGVKHSQAIKDAEFQHLLSIKQNIIRRVIFFSVLKPSITREPSEEYLKSTSTRYQSQVETAYEIIESANTVSAVKKYMNENNGVLVIQKGSRSLLDMFRKFFTNEIIHQAEIPVIILP